MLQAPPMNQYVKLNSLAKLVTHLLVSSPYPSVFEKVIVYRVNASLACLEVSNVRKACPAITV